jgi:hypothetical protein
MRYSIHLALVGLFALGGCGTSPTDAVGLEVRTTRGTTTLVVGSCEDACGGRSNAGTCWCDSQCTIFGDCCDDLAATCGNGQPRATCEGYCGGKAGQGACWCDDACVTYGDCCDDKGERCDGAPICLGGGEICAAVCHGGPMPELPAGCPIPSCMCPPVCPDVMCEMACEYGFKQDENGCELCDCKPKTCGGIAAFPCPEGLICADNPDDGCDPQAGGADCGGICLPILCLGFTKVMCPIDHYCVYGYSPLCPSGEGGFCGGINGIPCVEGLHCVDDPADTCDPQAEGNDCGGLCAQPPVCPDPSDPAVDYIDGTREDPSLCAQLRFACPSGSQGFTDVACGCGCVAMVAPDSCSGHCGEASADESCYCDELCVDYGDCCTDLVQWCAP